MTHPRQAGACEHQYLAGNCPYCEILRLRGEILRLKFRIAALEREFKRRHIKAPSETL